MIFVCLSCCKKNECIFEMLLELWLDSKDTLCLKKSAKDWKKEECILHSIKSVLEEKCNFHYKQEQSLLKHISNIMYILFVLF